MIATDLDLELHLAGVGAGPSNLSVAALAASVGHLRCRFFDRQYEQRWHSGLMLPGSVLQVSHLKDLVTMVDPTSPYTFLNFLARTGRLYRFASMTNQVVSRQEYESYLRWVAGQLDSVEFGCAVDEVTFAGGAFRLATRNGAHTARHLSVAVGPAPWVPPAVARLQGPTMLHAAHFAGCADRVAGRDVVVVGGGQSGAEVVDELLGRPATMAPRSLAWVTRRQGFPPLDDSAFTNEWFHPDYVRYFHSLAAARRRELVAAQQMSSDGVSADLLERIYRRLYDNEFVSDLPIRCTILPGRELTGVGAHAGDRWRLALTNVDSGTLEAVDGDLVVLATGYEFRMPPCLDPIADRIPTAAHGQPALDADYSVPWAGPEGNKLFFLNAGRFSHGIADPNLSLASWRAVTVLNSITRTPWHCEARSSACTWEPPDATALRVQPILAELLRAGVQR